MRAIDADALMEAINTWPKFGVDGHGRIVPWNEGYEPYIHLRDVVIAITGMPTIEPQRKTGRWLLSAQRDGFEGSECSQCGYHIFNTPLYGYKYCPNCGADMRKE